MSKPENLPEADYNSKKTPFLRSVWRGVESNLGLGLVVGVPTLLMWASTFGSAALRPQNPDTPSWAKDFSAEPEGDVCHITDLKTQRKFSTNTSQPVSMARGFTVASAPSSCIVTAPKEKGTCQLRVWPIEPIC